MWALVDAPPHIRKAHPPASACAACERGVRRAGTHSADLHCSADGACIAPDEASRNPAAQKVDVRMLVTVAALKSQGPCLLARGMGALGQKLAICRPNVHGVQTTSMDQCRRLF